MIIPHKKNIRKYINYVLYFLPLLIIRLDSLTYHISALSALSLTNETEKDESKHEVRRLKRDIIWLVSGILINYVCTYIAFFNVINDNGIIIGEFILLNKYSMLIPLLFALIWRKKHLTKKRDKYFVRKTLIYIFPMSLSMAIYSIVKPCFLGASINYINSFWCAIFLAAFFEEFFYRGFLYRLLGNILFTRLAIIITAIIFTTSHFNLLFTYFHGFSSNVFINIVMVFILSIVTCLLYDRTNSIITPIVYHSINNGAVYYFLSMLFV